MPLTGLLGLGCFPALLIDDLVGALVWDDFTGLPTTDRVGYVGVSAPTVNRQTQAAPVLESGIATNTGSGKGQGPLWRY